jgi:hypothetical protein
VGKTEDPVDTDTFWTLMAASRLDARARNVDQADALRSKLAKLPAADIASFGRHFFGFHAQAYRWDLWAAAYVIQGGCSDDAFSDFRAGLIGLGRDVFQNALADPGSLARLPPDVVEIANEALLYVADEAYEGVAGEPMPDDVFVPVPAEPAGDPWEEEDVDNMFPGLAERFPI